jgi:uncharacterized protein YecT (DUF1311 family)
MKSLLSVLILLTSLSVTANNTFTPTLLTGEDNSVCSQVLKYYQDLYNSQKMTTTSISSTEELPIPEFTTNTLPNDESLHKAKIQIDNKEKIIIYYARWMGWRGLIYTGYLVDSAEEAKLTAALQAKESTKEFQHFYPVGTLKYGSNFSWWLNFPFQYNNQWYLVEDFGDFTRHDAIRDVYQIHADSSSSKVCSLQIYKNYEPRKNNEELPYFAAYINSTENILLSPGECGTSTPEIYASNNGRLFTSTALIRPWAASKVTHHAHIRNQLDSHFNHWKYTDAWSYRESESLSYLATDAARELKDYYISRFGYNIKQAQELADKIIKEIPFGYYSLGVYEDSKKDFSALEKMASGQFDNWNSIDSIMKLQYGKINNIAFTLMLDNPNSFSKNTSLKLDVIENYYKKNLLMYAAHMNNYDTTEWLIKNQFPLNRITYMEYDMCNRFPERVNRSALTYATENASIHLIKLLVDAGEMTDIVDSKGNNLDFYLQKNPRFTDTEKKLGLKGLLEQYSTNPIHPSFNCNQTLGKIEQTICNSKGLSIYDSELNSLYKNAINKNTSYANSLKISQRDWLKIRSNLCSILVDANELKNCIARTTRSRIHYLSYIYNNI